MIMLFEEADLVSFGNFILESVAGTSKEDMPDRLDGVTTDDIDKWYFEMKEAQDAEESDE